MSKVVITVETVEEKVLGTMALSSMCQGADGILGDIPTVDTGSER
jgi:hypothetical protein